MALACLRRRLRWQPWLGHELLKRLIGIGRDEKLDRIVGQILTDNHAMQHICKQLGFKIVTEDDGRTCTAQFIF
jgi:RimJ/RimL family protein N-acetyltransferase